MRIMKRLLAMVLLVMMCCAMYVSCLAVEYPCEGITNAKSVRMRKKASSSGEQITTIDKGVSVTVLEEVVKKNGDIWYKVKTAKGKQGYILSDYLSVPETDRIEMAKDSLFSQNMKLKVRASCSDYNSVGKNWTQYFEWNGMQVIDGEMESYAAPSAEFSLYVRIREQDKKPDTTTEKMFYTPTAEEVENGFTLTQKIKVTENAGTYKGNSAIWTVTYTFTPVK